MADEIEFKFLTNFTSEEEVKKLTNSFSDHYTQGYLSTDPDCTIRVRDLVSNPFPNATIERLILTIKGRNNGACRNEYEIEVPRTEDMLELFQFCKNSVEKTRYFIGDPISGYVWEVDVFHGENQGLILAEIEVNNIEDRSLLCLPWWIGEEVTYDSRYYSSNLAVTPFNSWVK